MAALKRNIGIICVLILGCGIYTILCAPLAVAPGHIALVRSKLFGLSNTVYDSAGRHWVWSRLIPRDSVIYSFPEGESTIRSAQSFHLPPGEVPGVGNTNDFYCAMDVLIRWKIDKTSLPLLVHNGVTNEGSLVNLVMDRTVPLLRDALVNETEQALLANRPLNLPRAIDASIQEEAIPAIRSFLSGHGVALVQCDAYWTSLPDPARYARARAAIAEADALMVERIREWYHMNAELDRKSREGDLEAHSLAVIAKLITDYPKMLDYFMIAKLSDKIRLAVLPANDGASALRDTLKRMLNSAQTNHPSETAPAVQTATNTASAGNTP